MLLPSDRSTLAVVLSPKLRTIGHFLCKLYLMALGFLLL